MNANHVRPGNLKLIQGGLCPQTAVGSVRIDAAPENATPFKIKAMVFEEDTWLIVPPGSGAQLIKVLETEIGSE